ncbi:zinc-binding alcohol dehydrogenase [Pistricoccus aurantiacus]|uniref:Zinc-binding alcohol dehydrogenase n=1 Tax=Pistricoccus aurantiacus TaxID=1883414 RepID=A0A5B8SQE6_9GAMM|nr:zinc-binding alcohol dehydrogenase [Pistricoccus aurantiacus]QEA39362.1 zinc-binding alcohol dehydrogenase [Pistricoccus aurantiacus]
MKRREAQAFWSLGNGEGELRKEALAPLKFNELLIETHFSAISRGTESLVFHGLVPESEWQRMRAPFQAGDFGGPVKYGYASVGRVIEGDAAWLGRSVFCLYPHQDYYIAPSEMVLSLPEALPESRAVLAANMETAINGVWDAAIAPGDRVTVVGGGVVGLLVAYLAGRIPGTEVTLSDIKPERADIARVLGVEFTLSQQAPSNNDVVIHCSGHSEGLMRALELAGFEGRVVEMSWYGNQSVTLPLGEAFHSRRLTLRSSQVGELDPSRKPRWNHRRRLALALSLLSDPVLDQLISGDCAFEALPMLMPQLTRAESDVLCQRVHYYGAGDN